MVRYLQRVKRKYYPVNDRINVPEVRIIDQKGKNLGAMPTRKGLELAQESGLDLVLITEKAHPPIAKILNFRKFLHEKQRQGQDERKRFNEASLKTLRVGPHIDDNDLNTPIGRAKEFLGKGKAVKFDLMFKGRSISHPELGRAKLETVKGLLSEESQVIRNIEKKGKFMTMILGPKP